MLFNSPHSETIQPIRPPNYSTTVKHSSVTGYSYVHKILFLMPSHGDKPNMLEKLIYCCLQFSSSMSVSLEKQEETLGQEEAKWWNDLRSRVASFSTSPLHLRLCFSTSLTSDCVLPVSLPPSLHPFSLSRVRITDTY